MTVTALGLEPGPHARRQAVIASVHRRMMTGFAILAAVLTYLAYAGIAFDISGLISRAQPDRAVLLAIDSVAHKVHVSKSLRTDRVTIAVEGERTATYKTPPDWVAQTDDAVRVDLGEGYGAEIVGKTLYFTVPGYGDITVKAETSGIVTTLPDGPVPDWLNATEAKFDARPSLGRRVQVSRARIEVHRFFMGWENSSSRSIPNCRPIPSAASCR